MASRSRVSLSACNSAVAQLSAAVLFAEGKVLLGCIFFKKSEKESPYGLYITLGSDEKVRIKHNLKAILSHSHVSSILSVRSVSLMAAGDCALETHHRLTRQIKRLWACRSLHWYTVWHEIFAGVYFCGLWIFCVLNERIFAIRTDWIFLLGTPGLGINF